MSVARIAAALMADLQQLARRPRRQHHLARLRQRVRHLLLAVHVPPRLQGGDGVLGVCDYIVTQGQSYHIVEVSLNITVTPASPVEQSTWGKIKGLFR